MNKWIKVTRWVTCISCVLGTAGKGVAEDDFLIENQHTNSVINASWGNTYVGKHTDGNRLIISNEGSLKSADSFIGFSDTASSNDALITGDNSTWSIQNLQIGSELNSFNEVGVWSNGTVTIAGSLSILGDANSNSFTLGDGGTLQVGSDFDATMAGFNFESNGTLSVSRTLSNMDEVEGSRHLILTGANAEWLRSTNTVNVGAVDHGNSLTIQDGAQIDFTNLAIGAAGFSSNFFILASGAQSTIASNLTLSGHDNGVKVGGELTLAGNLNIIGTSNLFTVSGQANMLGDIDSNTGIQFDGGMLEASHNVDMKTIDGNGTMILTGNQGQWISDTNISIGAISGGSTLLIQDNAIVKTASIQIGSASSTGNELTLENGGKLILTGVGSVLHDDNTLTMNGGWLTFEEDWYNAINTVSVNFPAEHKGNTFEFHGKGFLFGGSWEGGSHKEAGHYSIRHGNTFIVNGTNASLVSASSDLHVGDVTSGNTLVVSNGASAKFRSLTLGDFSEQGGNDNLVLIGGAGTSVTSLNHTAIGGTLLTYDNGNVEWNDGGRGNVMRVEDGAVFHSSGTLHNRNSEGTSGLEIASGAIVAVNGYYQGSGAYLTIFTDSTGTNAGLLSANTAEFEAGARVGVDAVSALQVNQLYTNTLVEANTLIIGGTTNGTTANLAALDTSGRSLVNYDLMLQGGTNMMAIYSRRYISASAGFDPNSVIGTISDEIDLLAVQGNTAASNQVEILNLMTSSQQSQEMKQLYIYGLPTFMHAQSMLGGIDQVRARGRSAGTAAPRRPAPTGAAGPHAKDQGLQGWAKVYGGFGSRDKGASDFQNGYDAQTFGTVIGLDQSFGSWLFGLAGGYASSNLEGNNGDESDATTGYGILYANYGTEDWFGDLVLGLGSTSMDNASGTHFDTTSSVDASQTSFYIGGGKEAVDEQTGMLVRSLLGLQVCQFSQDAYKETSTTAVGKDVDAYDRLSYQSKLGISITCPSEGSKIHLESDFRAFWLHEFNGDDENIDYTLVDSNQSGQFNMRSPDQDTGQFGIGFMTKWNNGLRIRMDIDAQLSKSYYATAFSGSLLYEF